jgi:hypothetical protein
MASFDRSILFYMAFPIWYYNDPTDIPSCGSNKASRMMLISFFYQPTKASSNIMPIPLLYSVTACSPSSHAPFHRQASKQ